jgi:hypothetical protein
MEDRASQGPALKQIESSIQYPTNIFKSRQEKRGVSVAAGLINNGQQPAQLVYSSYACSIVLTYL